MQESNNNIAIKVDSLTKIYPLYNSPQDRLKEALHPLRKKFYKDFYALQNVSFNANKGDIVGIIGRNGSGKSTLLKILTGVLTPSKGTYSVKGRVSSLLELGTGFNPELTGLDNIYFNGTILGFTKKELDEKLNDIISFADIGEFIYQPVKSYSSGMYVRLAFAVAINASPDILIVDEALSVGDAFFQAKCYNRLNELKETGTTILLVSHDMNLVLNNCNKAILLNDGNKMMEGEPNKVVNRYLDLLFGDNREEEKSSIETTQEPADKEVINEPDEALNELDMSSKEFFHTRFGYNKDEYVWGNGGVKIIDYIIKNNEGLEYPKYIESTEPFEILIKAVFEQDFEQPVYGLLIKNLEGMRIYGTNSIIENNKSYTPRKTGDVVWFRFRINPFLASGHYLLCFGVSVDRGVTPLHRRYDSVLIAIQNNRPICGFVDLTTEFDEGVLKG